MDITLKNVQFNAALTEETHCFSATVYVDGKKMFGVKNAGHGGCNEEYHVKGGVDNVREAVAAIDEELAKDKREPSYDGLPSLDNCLEFVVCDRMNEWLLDREIKKTLRKVTYVRDGDIYSYPAKYKPTPEVLEQLQNAKWWKDDYIILNGRPIEEVRQYFK